MAVQMRFHETQTENAYKMEKTGLKMMYDDGSLISLELMWMRRMTAQFT